MSCVSPHDVDWEKIRADYENNPNLSLRRLAKKHGIPDGTIRRRSHEHHWAKFVPVVQRATSSITNAANLAIERTCKQVAERIEARTVETLKDLEPWIEEQRAVHVRHIVGLSRKGLKRIEQLYKVPVDDAKTEQFAAAATEKHDAIIRRNLGMGENGTGNTSLNVAVLVGGGRKVISGPSGPDHGPDAGPPFQLPLPGPVPEAGG